MKFLDGVKQGFGVTVGSVIGLYVSALVIGLVTRAGKEVSEKSDETTETEES